VGFANERRNGHGFSASLPPHDCLKGAFAPGWQCRWTRALVVPMAIWDGVCRAWLDGISCAMNVLKIGITFDICADLAVSSCSRAKA
jgi:hypothetical protein